MPPKRTPSCASKGKPKEDEDAEEVANCSNIYDLTDVRSAQEDSLSTSVTHFSFKSSNLGGQKSKTSRKNLKQIIAAERYADVPANIPTYINIEAGPSSLPVRKYCDLTGFEAKYVEPHTQLRYAASELYPLIRALPNDAVQSYLAFRNAAVQLK